MSVPRLRNHQWRRVGYYHGRSLQRCLCGVERIADQVRAGMIYRLHGQGDEAWSTRRPPCPPFPDEQAVIS